MAAAPIQKKTTGGGGADQRTHPRYAVNVNALLTGGRFESRACTIRDFCVVGMFISFEATGGDVAFASQQPIVAGEMVQVHFFLKVGARDLTFNLRAKVARVLPTGIGVELVDPQPDSIDALMHAARESQSAVRPAGQDAEGAILAIPGMDRPRLRKLVQETLSRESNRWFSAFFKKAENILFIASRESTSAADQRLYWDTSGVIKSKRAAIEEEVLKTLNEQLGNVGQGAATPATSAKHEATLSEVGLSLVESREFEEFLAVNEAIDKAETLYKARISELEQRLSHVYGLRIDMVNNPIGPGAVTRAFSDALVMTGIEGGPMRLVLQALQESVITDLNLFYESINAELKRQGVGLLEPAKTKPKIVETRARPGTAAPAPTPPPSDQMNPPPEGMGGATATPAGGQWPGGAVPPPGGQWPGAAGQPVAPWGGVASPQSGMIPAGYVPPTPGSFRAVQNLLDLQRQFQVPAAPVPGAPAATGTATVQELQNAMESVNPASLERSDGLLPDDYRQLLSAAVAAQSSGKSQKQLSDQDCDALQLVVEIVNAMITDPRVNDDVKPLIRRLRTPVNQIALSDPSFFENPQHPVRQVLNKITAVRGIGKDPNDPVRQRLDDVVKLLCRTGRQHPAAFAEVAADLDAIIEEQKQKYAANIAELVKASEEQQQVIKARRKAAGESAKPQVSLSGEWLEWLNRAKRLKTGDRLELVSGSQRQRVGVAWIGEEQSSFVLSDTLGKKVANLGIQELAMQLRRGSAKVLQQDALPAVERGMYASMQKLHEQLGQHVNSDPQTQLLNEKTFQHEIEKALQAAQQDNTSHVLAFITAPPPGDATPAAKAELIVELAARLRAQAGAEARMGRVGEDRLGVLVMDVSQGQGYEMIERLRAALAEKPWKENKLTLSAGMALFGADVHIVDSVFQAADKALGFALQAGGVTRIVHAEDTDQAAVKSRELLTEQLVQALADDRLQLAAQRVVPLRQDIRLSEHLELVATIKLGVGIQVDPAALRRAAEQTKSDRDLDRWLIHAGLQWAAANVETLPAQGWFILRLSPASLHDADMATHITNVLLESAVPPARVCFELTRTAELGQRSEADELVRALREFGCHFIFGDFGSGRSSFASAKDLQIELVKIGDLAQRDVVNDKADAALVRSTIEMAHFVGIPVVVDQVDDASTLALLRGLGVEYAQGTAMAAVQPL
jgi:EAL domain-containing protein (putative c-di-GMP-specific phosphodiesterase class I)/GGDEF domain-containing protein